MMNYKMSDAVLIYVSLWIFTAMQKMQF